MTKANDPAAIIATRIERNGPNECWWFNGHHNPQGYPTVWVRQKLRKVSHLVLEASGKPRPWLRALALHSCDNPRCVNPMHLRWGTHKDNAKDRLERTGYAGNRGEKNPNWVQTDEVVTAALSLVECTAKEAAKKVGVSQPTILRIWRDNGVLPRKAAPPPKAQDRALIHLTSLGAGWVGVSVSEMARDLGMASPNLHRALHELLRNGRVAKRGGGLGKVAEWKVLTP